jgi:hypothetical protein
MNDRRRSSRLRGPSNDHPTNLAIEQIERSILVVRGQKVLIDQQLAVFYEVETKAIVRAMKRNITRFPADFMFQLTSEEWDGLRCQIGTSNQSERKVTSGSEGRGGRRYAPFAFTEQGVAMLSGVLRSPRAVEVNIQIMRAFVRLRQLLSLHKELADRLEKIEREMTSRNHDFDAQFRKVFTLLDRLFSPPTVPRKRIGFHVSTDDSDRSQQSSSKAARKPSKRK